MIGKDYNRLYIPKKPPYLMGLLYHKYIRGICCACGVNGLPVNSCGEAWFSIMICEACHADICWHTKPQLLSLSNSQTQIEKNQQNKVLNLATLEVHTSASYAGMLRSAMVSFKYRTQLSALPLLLHAICQLQKPQDCFSHNSVIVAMPTTPERLGKRGFDPLMLFAHYLSIHWQIPIWSGISRVDNANRQQGLDRAQRRDNVQNAFAVTHPLPPSTCHHFILFDDVITTGTTLSVLADCLQIALNNTGKVAQMSAYAILGSKRQ